MVFQYHYCLKKEASRNRELNSIVIGKYQFEPVTAPKGDLWWGPMLKGKARPEGEPGHRKELRKHSEEVNLCK